MTRSDYLAALKQYLKPLPAADYQETLDYFTEYFEEAGPENEARVIEELGSPQEAAEKIIRSLKSEDAKSTVSQDNPQSSTSHQQQSYSNHNSMSEAYDAISELHIDVPVRDVLVETSPDALFHIHCDSDSMNNHLTSTVRDGKWYITEREHTQRGGLDWIIRVIKNGVDSSPIRIQIPTDTMLQTFSLQATSGDVSLSNLQISKGNIDLTSGDLTMQHCQLQQASLTLVSGDFEFSHTKLANSHISLVSGDCKGQSLEIAGNIKVDLTSGDVDLQLLQQDFSYTIETLTGDISIHNQQQESQSLLGKVSHYQSTTSTDSLTIHTVNGDIQLN